MCAKTIRGAIRWHIATELHADCLLLLTEVNGVYRTGARPRHDASIARTLPTPQALHRLTIKLDLLHETGMLILDLVWLGVYGRSLGATSWAKRPTDCKTNARGMPPPTLGSIMIPARPRVSRRYWSFSTTMSGQP